MIDPHISAVELSLGAGRGSRLVAPILAVAEVVVEGAGLDHPRSVEALEVLSLERRFVPLSILGRDPSQDCWLAAVAADARRREGQEDHDRDGDLESR